MHQYLAHAKMPIPKYKKKKPSRTASFGYSSQMEMFQDIIYNAPRPIICPVSGRNLDHLFRQEPEVWVWAMSHCLAKGKWPLFKLFKGNIVIVDPEVHRLYDSGTEAQRQAMVGYNWQYLYDLKAELKVKYENYAKTGTLEETPADTTEISAEEQDGTPTGT